MAFFIFLLMVPPVLVRYINYFVYGFIIAECVDIGKFLLL